MQGCWLPTRWSFLRCLSSGTGLPAGWSSSIPLCCRDRTQRWTMGRHSSGGTGTVPLTIRSQCPGSLLLSLRIKQLLGGEGEGGEGTALDRHQTPWAHPGAWESFPTLPSQSTQMPSVASKDQATGSRLSQQCPGPEK